MDGIINIEYGNIIPRNLALLSFNGKESRSISKLKNEIDVSDIESDLYMIKLSSAQGTLVDRLIVHH